MSTTYRPANGQPLHDEVPWCAAFVGWCLLRAEYERGETRRPHLATRIKIQEFLRSRGVL